jgi:hypothetical protein
MARRRASSNRYYGEREFGAPIDYVPARGPREAFLPPSASIDSAFYSDRGGNRGLLFGDDDNPNDDDYLLYHTTQMRGFHTLPEEKEEIAKERKRRAAARADVVRVEQVRAKADMQRNKFHRKEEEVETLRCALEDAKDADDGEAIAELMIKVADLKLRSAQEMLISQESAWLAHELDVEVEMAVAEMHKIERYNERNEARERIERVRTGHALAAAGRAYKDKP